MIWLRLLGAFGALGFFIAGVWTAMFGAAPLLTASVWALGFPCGVPGGYWLFRRIFDPGSALGQEQRKGREGRKG